MARQRDRGQFCLHPQAGESGGEPPGRGRGPGARAPGLEHGQTVERNPYDLLFGECKPPDGTPLGGPPGSGRKAAGLYVQLLAAEPHATTERKHALRIQATRQARPSPLFFDLTISLSNPISMFHASLGENARLARQAGDQAGTSTGPAWPPSATSIFGSYSLKNTAWEACTCSSSCQSASAARPP